MSLRIPTFTQPLSRSTVKSVDAEIYGAPSRPCCRCTGRVVRSGSFSTTSWQGAFATSTISGFAFNRASTSWRRRSRVVPKACARRERLPATFPASAAPSGPARLNHTALGLPSSTPANSASATGLSTFCISSDGSESRKRRRRKRSRSISVQLDLGGVVAEEPFVALGDRRAGPLAVHVRPCARRIGERTVVETLDVVGRAFHRAPGAVAPRVFIGSKTRTYITRQLRQRPRNDVAVLDGHVRALREE